MKKFKRLSPILFCCLFFAVSAAVSAAELTFTPPNPQVEIGGKITLSVSGTSGEVKWFPGDGQITGTGTQVTYWAPDQVGLDVVSVLDEAGNTGIVKIVILPKDTGALSQENANWEVFTNRSWVRAIVVSEDEKTLWVGTRGGLEQRDMATGELVRLFTNLDGLPSNEIRTLYGDSSGGLWIGIGGGLVYRSASGDWTIYNQDNSGLPSKGIRALLGDDSGGLWIGTLDGGLAYRSASGDWTVYNQDNSGLPDNWVTTLLGDDSGGLWIGTSDGLAYRSASGDWTIYNQDNSGLPSNGIRALLGDDSGGLWIGTSIFTLNLFDGEVTESGGLAYRSANGEWSVYDRDNSGLPSDWVSALFSDDSGGLWIGVHHGLVYRSASGDWTIYNQDNSGLPSNRIRTLLGDDSGGLWIGTSNGGLAYRSASGDWTVYNQDNSGLPDNWVTTLLDDDSGGLWIGTDKGGLAYRSVGGEWTVYNTDNARLPSNWIKDMYGDSSGGLWIGTDEGGLAYRSVGGKWTVYNTENSGLPGNNIDALYGDSSGGLWIGTEAGLAYRSVAGEWTVYNTENSGLPSNYIRSLYGDSSGGLWIGTHYNGLAHLTFSKKNTLCADITDEQCQNILTGKRAAIIIAGGGNDKSNSLWGTTAEISDNIYKMFSQRGFDNDEIYYLSPQSYADFNGDGFDDCIVDAPATPRCRIKSVDNPIEERPLTVDDVRQTLAWAKTGGKLDQPLYVFFINHGGTDRFQLVEGGYLEVQEFKTILDDYQDETGNDLVLVIDTCFSGSLLQKLIAPNRAIISSTGDGLAYFDRAAHQGFSRYLAKGLYKGWSFSEAFDYASEKQDKLVKSLGKNQNPQWHDGQDGAWLDNLYINGAFTVGDITLTVEALTASTTLSAGQNLSLSTKVDLAQGTVKQVWAVLKPPKVNLVMDSNGTPILAFPRIALYRTEEENVWATTWHDAVYNGEHEFTFYAKDNQGNIADSDPITINVIGGAELPERATVQITLSKDRYQANEPFRAELTEELGWGYDLYAAILLPDGNFFALRDTNKVASLNKAKKWVGDRTAHSPVTLFELNLPENLPTGQYCLYGILSPENEIVLKNMELWVWTQQCFEVF